ncbi:MAG: putative membrane protein [Alteromonas naphthalenivorans]|jgi:uncharacterized membrane protein
MISFLSFISVSISIASSICYSLIIKKSHEKKITCLASLIIAYILFPVLFCIFKIFTNHSISQTQTALATILTNNIPLYLCASISMLLGTLTLAYLLDKYSLSQVILVSQLGIPLTVIGYYAMGNPTTSIELIGIIIITLGSIISGFKKFEFPNIFKSFLTIPLALYFLGILRYSLNLLVQLITFTASQKTFETLSIHDFINRDIPVSIIFSNFENAIYFKIGTSSFIIIIFGLYILYLEKFSISQVSNKIQKNFYSIIIGGVFLYTAIGAYFYAFQIIPNKATLGALFKLEIPCALFFAVWYLKEKITLPQIVGTVFIFFGSIVIAIL